MGKVSNITPTGPKIRLPDGWLTPPPTLTATGNSSPANGLDGRASLPSQSRKAIDELRVSRPSYTSSSKEEEKKGFLESGGTTGAVKRYLEDGGTAGVVERHLKSGGTAGKAKRYLESGGTAGKAKSYLESGGLSGWFKRRYSKD